MILAKTSDEFESKSFNNEVFDAFTIVEDDRECLTLFFVMLDFPLLKLKFFLNERQIVGGSR